ncbi:MAG: hypothetical protein L3J44_06125 [Campylobacteraceae bacterium]|nr:hypothetical protein [Campylobacteraceae bacterium]
MKKIILIVLPIIVLAGLAYFKFSKNVNDVKNMQKVPLKIIPNKMQDPQCHMYLSGDTFAVEVITSDFKTHFFDDPGCSILWMKSQNINPSKVTIWAYSMDSKKWINAKKAYYSISDFQTPMHYGFGAHKNKKKGYIDFKEMRLRMLRGENMTNPKIRKKILQQEKEEK